MKVLAVAAHPDDETLGAGGTLLKHLSRGDQVFWLILTAPSPDDWPAEMVSRCLSQVQSVADAYGFTETIELGMPAAGMDLVSMRDVVDGISGALRAIKPDRIYTVGDTDAHTDHLVAFEGLMLALKPFRPDYDIESIYSYEVLSSTDAATGWRHKNFVPNVYSDVCEFLERKLEIMNLFENQLQPEPLPRSSSSIRALARYRGATIGIEYAEAFSVVRQIIR